MHSMTIHVIVMFSCFGKRENFDDRSLLLFGYHSFITLIFHEVKGAWIVVFLRKNRLREVSIPLPFESASDQFSSRYRWMLAVKERHLLSTLVQTHLTQ